MRIEAGARSGLGRSENIGCEYLAGRSMVSSLQARRGETLDGRGEE